MWFAHDRFVRASRAAERPATDKGIVGDAFEALDSVRSGDYTKWNIVYEPSNLRIHFRSLKNPKIKTISLAQFERFCQTPVMMADVDLDSAGDAFSRFMVYDGEVNRQLVSKSLQDILGQLPPGSAEQLAAYPESQR